jgi:putative aminopeptidase FrvX
MKPIWSWSFGPATFLVLAILPAIASRSFADTLHFVTIREQVVEARLKEFTGNNKQRETTLKRLFAEAGCDGEHLSEQPVKGTKQPNLVCMLPGKGQRTIIVGAHFDHVSEGDGVVDNWSGASLLPSLYQSVKGIDREHTYIFIGFTAEEEGEVGSRFYVRQMSNEAVAATDAMVNLDTLGLGPTLVWQSHSDKLLTGALTYLAKRLELPLHAVNVDQVGSSDSEQFAERKIPRITVHSLTQETWNERILHTNKDKLAQIKFDEYYQTYRLMAAYLVFLDQILPPQDAVAPH